MSIACLRVAKMTARLAPVVGKACFTVRRRVEIPTALAHPGIVTVSMVVARGQRAVTGRTLEGRSAVAHGLVVFDKTVTIPVTIWLRACEIAVRTIVVVDTVTCRTHAAPMTSADIVIGCPGTRNVAPLTTPTRLTPASKDAADELAGPVPTVTTTSRAFTPPIWSIIPLCLALALGIRVTGPMSAAYVAIGSNGLVELLAFSLLFVQCAGKKIVDRHVRVASTMASKSRVTILTDPRARVRIVRETMLTVRAEKEGRTFASESGGKERGRHVDGVTNTTVFAGALFTKFTSEWSPNTITSPEVRPILGPMLAWNEDRVNAGRHIVDCVVHTGQSTG